MMDPGNISDRRLVRRAADGDRSAWEALYVRHRDFAYRVALRFLGDPEASRDIVQDVFVAVFQAAGNWRNESAFRTWLYRVTANRCINARRRETREIPAGSTSDPDGPLATIQDSPTNDPGRQVEILRDQARLKAAFDSLPDRQRLALVLVVMEGLRYDEVAEAMDTSVSAVESLLVRARRTLAEACPSPDNS